MRDTEGPNLLNKICNQIVLLFRCVAALGMRVGWLTRVNSFVCIRYAAQAATGRYLPVEIVTLIGEMAKDEENVILEDRILPLAMDSVPNTDSEGSESEESEDEDSDAEDSASEESEDSDSDSEHSNAEATDGENSENDPFDDEEDDTVIQDTDIALDADGYQDPRFVDSGWGAECLC